MCIFLFRSLILLIFLFRYILSVFLCLYYITFLFWNQHLLHLNLAKLSTNYTKFPNVRGGFIHVPYAVSQVVNKPATPSMAIADITAALEAAVKAAVEYEQDIKVIGGETH